MNVNRGGYSKPGAVLVLGVASLLLAPNIGTALETDKAAAQAHVEKSSSPFADLVAWLTLLDAWSLISIAVILACLAWFFYKLQKGNSRFNFGDAFIDNTTGQTSYLRIIIFGSFISSWLIVMIYVVRGLDVPSGISTLVLGINGIFVTNIILNRGFEVFDPRVKAQAINTAPAMANQPEPAASTGGDVTIKTEVNKP